MIPPPYPRKRRARIPPRNEPARPSPIVAKMPMGSGPGSASRASAPTIRPQSTRTRMNQRVRPSPFPAAPLRTRPRALDDEVPLRLVLVVGEDAGLVQVDELAEEVDRLEPLVRLAGR